MQEFVLKAALLVGLYQLLRFVVYLTDFFYRFFLRPLFTRSLFAKYGSKKSWALVTGGSDGIGLEMCQQLAAQGFNIIMCSRSEDKIRQQLKSITTVETRCLVIDLGTVHTVADYRKILDKECQGLEIAVVCLNAGFVVAGPIDCQSDAQIESVYTLNAMHVVLMAKVLLEQMTNRFKTSQRKSALIVTSSGMANIAMPGMISYSSTKILVSRFCESIAEEVRELGVDVLSWEAGSVTTNLNRTKGAMTLTT